LAALRGMDRRTPNEQPYQAAPHDYLFHDYVPPYALAHPRVQVDQRSCLCDRFIGSAG
jgi:hypothetical protein